MRENAINKINNCSENDALSIAYYLYQLSTMDLSEDLEMSEEIQKLYNALVNKLNLEKHADEALKYFLTKLEKSKVLTPKNTSSRYIHPFDSKSKLEKNYREDMAIYDNCQRWSTKKPRDINLVRALFSSNKYNLPKVIALTFFTEPGCFEDEKYSPPNKIVIPQRIKKAINDLSGIKFAVDTLKLSTDEARLLQVVFRSQSTKELYDVCNNLYRSGDFSRIMMFSKCLDKPQKDIRLLLKTDQKLNSYGLIDSEGDMDQDAMLAIYEKDIGLYFTDIVKKDKTTNCYSLNSFNVSKEQTDVAIQLLKSEEPVSILLFGAAGSGKTEYAKSLIEAAGLKMMAYRNELEVNGRNDDVEVKALSRLNCYLSLKKENQVLVVDEAEKVLQTREFSFFGMNLSSNQKGTVNKMLEKSENKCIYIVNYTNEMDISTLRRFNYSIKFNSMPKDTIRSIAAKKLTCVKLPSALKNQILDLCGQYKVTGASIDNVVKTIKALDYQNGKEDKVISDVKSVLESNSSLLYGKKIIRDSVSSTYNLSAINSSIPAEEIVQMLEASEEYKKENLGQENLGVRCIFFGVTGSGKTELARYISQKLQKPLLLKRCSDLISPYVGQTEINIKEAFEEALSTESILLLDEADSFFGNRESTSLGYERTMTNEFLTQLEEFPGIVIATTNLRKFLDPAIIRRFHLAVEFKALKENGVRNLLNSVFGKYKFSEEQINKLHNFGTVTPGDFGALSGRIRFVPKDKINSDYIISELINIQLEKQNTGNKPIGFSC